MTTINAILQKYNLQKSSTKVSVLIPYREDQRKAQTSHLLYLMIQILAKYKKERGLTEVPFIVELYIYKERFRHEFTSDFKQIISFLRKYPLPKDSFTINIIRKDKPISCHLTIIGLEDNLKFSFSQSIYLVVKELPFIKIPRKNILNWEE